MSLRQENATCGDTVRDKTTGQLLCSLLAALVLIDIEGEIDGARSFGQLAELVRVEMGSQRTGDVMKARLAQDRIIEQSLDKNHLWAVQDLLPGIQTALDAGEKSMREGNADAAAIQVDDVVVLTYRKDDALIESVATTRVEQTGLPQQIEAMTL